MNPYLLLGAVTVGVIAAVSCAIFSVLSHRGKSNHQYAKTNPSFSSPPLQARNLTCTFCGQTIVADCHQFACGHTCHKICLKRAQSRNQVCGFCRNAGEVLEDAPPTSEPNLRRRDVASMRTASSHGTTVDCSFCEIPAPHEESVRLPCGHFAHSECYETMKDVITCVRCAEARLPDD